MSDNFTRECREMTDIEKLKEDKKKALDELDKAMNTRSPEYVTRIQNEEK